MPESKLVEKERKITGRDSRYGQEQVTSLAILGQAPALISRPEIVCWRRTTAGRFTIEIRLTL